MNKTIKIISVLLVTLILVTTLSNTVLASYTGIINSIDSEANNGEAKELGKIKETAAKIVKALRNISAIVAVIVITVLGIKYMIGSTEERAGYKKSFIPLIVGIVVVVAAASIASAIFSIAE